MDTQEILNDPVLTELIERRDDEPANAYTAFVYFGRMQEAERHSERSNTIVAAFIGTSEMEVREWRRKYKWDDRASLVDAYGYKLSFSHTLELLKQDNRLFVKHNREFKEKIIKVSDDALQMLVDMVGDWKQFKPKIGDLPAVLNAIVKVRERVSTLPSDLMDNLSAQQNDLNKKSPEELEAYEKEINREIQLALHDGGEQ